MTLRDTEIRVLAWCAGIHIPAENAAPTMPVYSDRPAPEPVRTEIVNGHRVTWYITAPASLRQQDR